MNKLTFTLLVMILLFLLVGCKPNTPIETTDYPVDKTLCQFHQSSCDKQVDDLTVSFSLNPPHAPSEKPLTVTLSASAAIENVQMHIEGRDMFMGIIPVSLSASANNQFTGSLIFGSCSSDYMVWRVFVSFDYKQQPRTLIYDFLADNPLS